VSEGHEVHVLDNLSSSKRFPEGTVEIQGDVKEYFQGLFLEDYDYDQIYHLACQASPPRYQANPIDTMMTNVVGTRNILKLVRMCDARILFTSTSEVYGDPKEHPQKESYLGNVNCIGPRACYDVGKRAAECLCYDYQRQYNTDVRVARVFNTFGPHMDLKDGRVVTNFIRQALEDEALTIYGDGNQTRSFCYVDDMVNALIALMESNHTTPINLGNPDEIPIKLLAREVEELIYGKKFIGPIEYVALPEDDPKVRRPNIDKAKNLLGWEPKISRIEGLKKTVEYAKKELGVK
jgi:UDP-glucuronate decarboxylase